MAAKVSSAPQFPRPLANPRFLVSTRLTPEISIATLRLLYRVRERSFRFTPSISPPNSAITANPRNKKGAARKPPLLFPLLT